MLIRLGDAGTRKEFYAKLLIFLHTNEKIGVDRLYGILSSTGEYTPTEIFMVLTCHIDLYEARAILLGRLGRHDQALELFVYRLQDYLKAEE